VTNLQALVSLPLLSALLALFTASGCEKVNDVPRLKDEALTMASGYQERFDDLAHRAAAINPDRLTTTEVQRVYLQAKSTLDRFRNDVRQFPVQAQTSAVNGNPEDLQKLIDVTRERFEDGVIEATTELTTVENWLTAADQHGAQRAPATPAAPEPATEDPAAAPGSETPIR
jgi:hypothetical protein